MSIFGLIEHENYSPGVDYPWLHHLQEAQTIGLPQKRHLMVMGSHGNKPPGCGLTLDRWLMNGRVNPV
jgi:hypothetical protein